eukprot:ctg_1952.g644
MQQGAQVLFGVAICGSEVSPSHGARDGVGLDIAQRGLGAHLADASAEWLHRRVAEPQLEVLQGISCPGALNDTDGAPVTGGRDRDSWPSEHRRGARQRARTRHCSLLCWHFSSYIPICGSGCLAMPAIPPDRLPRWPPIGAFWRRNRSLAPQPCAVGHRAVWKPDTRQRGRGGAPSNSMVTEDGSPPRQGAGGAVPPDGGWWAAADPPVNLTPAAPAADVSGSGSVPPVEEMATDEEASAATEERSPAPDLSLRVSAGHLPSSSPRANSTPIAHSASPPSTADSAL